MKKLLSVEQAAELMGVSTSTMRRWEKEGKLIPDERTVGNQRRYLLSSIKPQMKYGTVVERRTIAYARVSSHD
jgi:excisionase family DNA binding protein